MRNQRRIQAPIEINEVVLAMANPIFSAECFIYRVPDKIRNLNPGAYTPNFVSIGPFHYGNNNCRSMESHKQVFCRKFIERAETTFDELMSCVQDSERSVRDCYSDNIDLTPQDLCNIILVDCGFIIELFLRPYLGERTDDSDVIRSKRWLVNGIHLDLLLLENQLPFFILENLYNLAFASHLNDSETTFPSFLDTTFRYFKYFNKLELSATHADATSIKHFTDLLRTFHLQQPSNERPSIEGGLMTPLNSATELNEAGVKFEVNKESPCLLNLKLRGHRLCYLGKGSPRLKIPKIIVMGQDETLFRNMIALEQCHYPFESYICNYVEVFGFLIKTGKDVDFLVKKKIIVNWSKDSDALAKMFTRLGTNIANEAFNKDYVAICKDLDAFCGHPWYSRKATLRRDYCNTPWKKLACFAAILVIILTIIQTICSILQVL